MKDENEAINDKFPLNDKMNDENEELYEIIPFKSQD